MRGNARGRLPTVIRDEHLRHSSALPRPRFTSLSQTAMSSPSHPSSDWTGDVLECPLTRYSREFRTLVDTETRRVAELLGLPISRVCELCGRDGVIAIGKKIAEIGNVYLNVGNLPSL